MLKKGMDNIEDEELAGLLVDSGDFDALSGTGDDSERSVDDFLDDLLADEADDEGAHAGEPSASWAGALQEKWAGPALQQRGRQGARHDRSAWALFEEADSDDSGILEGGELAKLGDSLRRNFALTTAQYQSLSSKAGISLHSKLDLPGFRVFASLLYVFKMADTDKDNLLDGVELSFAGFDLAKNLAWADLSPEAYRQLFQEADANSDAKLDPAELKHFLIAARESYLPPGLAHLFKKTDTDSSGVLAGAEVDSLLHALQEHFWLSAAKCKELLMNATAHGPADRLDRRAFKGIIMAARRQNPLKTLPPRMAHFFKVLDKDRSGFLEDDELALVESGLKRRFGVTSAALKNLVANANKDSDKKISPAELKDLVFKARRQSPYKQMPRKDVALFRKMDRDGSHALERAEMEAAGGWLRRQFNVGQTRYGDALAAADADEDGRLRPQETVQLVAALRRGSAAVARGRAATSAEAAAQEIFHI